MTVLWEGFLQGLLGIWTIARIVIPLMIVLEIAQQNGLLQKLNRVLARPFRVIGLSEEGAFPVVVAIFFGITFGSGVIINHVREGKVSAAEARVVGTFVAVAHALVEDTLLFWILGAPLLYLLLPRLGAAYLLSFIVHRWSPKSASVQGERFQGIDQ